MIINASAVTAWSCMCTLVISLQLLKGLAPLRETSDIALTYHCTMLKDVTADSSAACPSVMMRAHHNTLSMNSQSVGQRLENKTVAAGVQHTMIFCAAVLIHSSPYSLRMQKASGIGAKWIIA